MDLYTFGLGVLIVVVVVLVFLRTTALMQTVMVARVQGQATVKSAQKLADTHVRNAMRVLNGYSQQARRRKPEPDDDEEDDEEDEEEETLMERAVRQFAAGAGIDMDKIADGDMAEMQKAQGLLGQFNAWRQQNGGMTNGHGQAQQVQDPFL